MPPTDEPIDASTSPAPSPTPAVVVYKTKEKGVFESDPMRVNPGQSSVYYTFNSPGYPGSGRAFNLIIESSKDGVIWNHRATFFVPGTKIDPDDYWFLSGTDGEGFVKVRVEFVEKDNTPNFNSEATIT